ncbi:MULTISPECIES: two-component system sensor histidine kinase NtrB [Roseovarius]|jgi:two-component system nitrogen regulation sensor histidine kinase GlnL|uniref:histidine kinase n=1 Tax=Roseovarius nubinhibens TaxID=314263 RepID=A0A348WEI8_9RHOB|nr:PAS domain-containing sensor histidine kinase [Roseovarius nubinhibens]
MSGIGDTIWAALPVPGILVDGEDLVSDLNTAAEGFLNLSSRSVRGRPLWDVLRLAEPPLAAVARAREQVTPLYINDATIETGPRSRVQAGLQIAPLSGQDGAMVVLVAPRDAAGRPGPGGAISAKSSKSAIGMAEMLAHEIKNPLAGITGAAQLLSMTLSEEDQELTDLIVAESRRIVGLLEQVEQFGDVRPPERSAVNLHDILDRARRSAQLSVAGHMKVIEIFDPSLPPAHGDADQLLQVLLNLIRNAAQAAGPAGGTITLRTYYEHGLRLQGPDGEGQKVPLQIEIEDDGPGLPADIADEVFDPFVSGRENGTGLGLALAAKIIAAHGGWIGVTSEPGCTVFRLSLPMAPRELQEDN